MLFAKFKSSGLSGSVKSNSRIIAAAALILIALFIILISYISALSLDADAPDSGALDSAKKFDIKIPGGAVLTVSDIRVKGFTLSWTGLGEKNCEYAVAVSHQGKIDDYKTALENNHIILDFTSGDILENTYRVTKLIAGKNYEIKLFARKKNTQPAEYLSAKATLPYIDEAELVSVFLDGQEMLYNSSSDSYTHVCLPEITPREYIITYKLARQCVLYIDGVNIGDDKLAIKTGENLLVTAVNEKTGAARDYEISAVPIDNGVPIVIINVENSRPVTSKQTYLSADIAIIDSKINPSGDYINGLFSGSIEIKGRGNSSFGSPKKGYNIKTADKTGFLDMAESKDWMLMGNYSDKSLMRNYIAYELYRDFGAAFSPRLRFVDLILNGEYFGNYVLGERIKIDAGRLDLPKIKASETVKITKKGTLVIPPTSGGDLSGSYVLEVNSTDKYSKDEIIFETKRINWNNAHFFSIKQPGAKNMTPEAWEYISNYVNETEDAIFAGNFKDPDKGYRKYIETSTFIDWYIVNEIFKNVDAGFHTSVYFYKPRGGKLCMGPVWDFDLGAGNADYGGCDDPKGWHVRNSAWFTRLFEDEAFAEEFKDRWNYIKENYLDKTFKRIDDTAKLLDKSQEMNFAKFKILGVYVWPNAGDVKSRRTYGSEIDYLKDWLSERIDWMDKEINK